MKYQQMYNQIAPNFLKKYGDGEKAFQEVMKVQRKSIPIKRFNEELARKVVDGKKYEGPLLQDKFTPTEKKERAALGLKIREKMARYAIARHVSQKQADELLAEKIIKESSKDKTANGDRYPEELMFDFSGKPGAAEKNAEISALFINASDAAIDLKEGEKNPYEKEFNEVHENLVKEFEAYNVDDLISRNLSDAELIEHFEILERSKGFCMQVQNIRDCYREMKIDLPPELKKRMDALVPKLRILETYEQRLGVIDSPYYPEIDPEDPALSKIAEDVVADEVVLNLAKEDSQPEEFGFERGEFFVYSGDAASFNQSYYSAETEAMGEMLQQMGAKRENIVFEIDGKLSKTPFYQPGKESNNFDFNVLPGLNSGKIKSLRIFDKTDPTREIKVPKTNEKNYQFNKMLQGKTSLNPPQPPKEVPKPGFFTKLFNSWFGVFQKDIDNYKKYQDDLAAYPAKQAAFEEEKKALTGLEKNYSKEKKKFEKEKASIEELKSKDFTKETQAGVDRMLSAYSNKPEYLTQYTKQGNNMYGGIDEKTFSELETFDIEGVTIGGKQVSEMDFAALAVAATLQPESKMDEGFLRNHEGRENYDADGLIMNAMTMFTADIARDPPRHASVGHFFTGIKNGRIAAQQALQDYKNGDPEKMADLLAEGLLKFELWICETGTGTPASTCPTEFFAKMADMLEQDSKLKTLVEAKAEKLTGEWAKKEKAFGEKAKESLNKMKELEGTVDGLAAPGSEYDKAVDAYEVNRAAYDHHRRLSKTTLSGALKDIKAFKKANELNRKAAEARNTIKEAAISGQKLDPKVKEQCIRDMLRVAAMDTCLQLQRQSSQDKTTKYMEEVTPLLTKDIGNKSHIIGNLSTTHQFAESKPVSIMVQLSEKNGLQNLDTYVNSSVKKETLEKLMNTSEMDLLKLDHTTMTNIVTDDKRAIIKEKRKAHAQEKQEVKTVEKQVSGPTNEKKKENAAVV